MSVYIGIDPGINGAIVIIENGEVIVHDAPRFKGAGQFDYAGMHDIICKYEWVSKVHAGVEKVTANAIGSREGYEGSGKANAGVLMGSWHVWWALLTINEISREHVPIRSWQHETMPGVSAASRKDKAFHVRTAQELFPEVSLGNDKKKAHNRADALLIAEYIRRKHSGS